VRGCPDSPLDEATRERSRFARLSVASIAGPPTGQTRPVSAPLVASSAAKRSALSRGAPGRLSAERSVEPRETAHGARHLAQPTPQPRARSPRWCLQCAQRIVRPPVATQRSAPSLIDGSYPFPPSTTVTMTKTVPMRSTNCKALGSSGAGSSALATAPGAKGEDDRKVKTEASLGNPWSSARPCGPSLAVRTPRSMRRRGNLGRATQEGVPVASRKPGIPWRDGVHRAGSVAQRSPRGHPTVRVAHDRHRSTG